MDGDDNADVDYAEWMQYVPYTAIVLAVVILVYWVIALDCDLNLWFWRWFGRRPRSLKGKVVWITGASGGIGEALAIKLARNGCKVVLSATRQEKLEQVRQECLQGK